MKFYHKENELYELGNLFLYNVFSVEKGVKWNSNLKVMKIKIKKKKNVKILIS